MSLDKLKFINDIWELLQKIFGLIVLASAGLFIIRKIIKINWRLGKNLGRGIFIYCPSGGKRLDGQPMDMKREVDVLRRSGFFKIPAEVKTDFNNIDEEEIKNSGLVIVGYYKGMKYFKEIVEMVKRNGKPLIIYTFELDLKLEGKDKKTLSVYKWHSLSSMPLRLVGDVFAIMASFDYGQNKH